MQWRIAPFRKKLFEPPEHLCMVRINRVAVTDLPLDETRNYCINQGLLTARATSACPRTSGVVLTRFSAALWRFSSLNIKDGRGLMISRESDSASSRPASALSAAANQGFYAEIDLPPGASVNRTDALTSEVEKIVWAEKSAAALTSIIGFSQLNNVALSDSAFLVIRLAPFEQRLDASQSVQCLIYRIAEETAGIPGANILLYNAPPIIELGSSGGFQYELESIAGQSPGDLAATLRALIFEANQQTGTLERIQHL
jgi:hypothetical protein